MIQKARERINAHGVNLCKSSTPGHKIIGTSVFKSDSNSTTISRRPIIEVPEGVLPDDCDIEQARSVLAGMVLEGDLLPDEIEALLSVYPVWSDMDDGTLLEADDLLVHAGQLYKIVQGHNKQSDGPPDTTAALLTKAVPDSVISVRFQPSSDKRINND
jgi:hypothetical protein